jgi:hypothetical protein
MQQLFGGVHAPTTLGSLLREFAGGKGAGVASAL